MDVPAEWEPRALFEIGGRCIRLEESLTLFDDASIIERTAAFTTTRTFDEVASAFVKILGALPESGFPDEAIQRSLEWSFPGDVVVTLDEEATGTLSVSVSSHHAASVESILVQVSRSPLATLDAQLTSCGFLSGTGSLRALDEPTKWHLQGTIDDDEREVLVRRLVEAGFDDQGLENHFVKDDLLFVVGDYHWIAFVSAASS